MKNSVTNQDRLRILVVEDDEPTREAMLLKFKAKHVEADFAKDGIEGLEKLKEDNNFSGILLDLRMPRADGFAFMEEKNKDDAIKDIPVVVFSNFSQPEFVDRAVNLGAKGYLVKVHHNVDEIVHEMIKCAGEGVCLIDRA